MFLPVESWPAGCAQGAGVFVAAARGRHAAAGCRGHLGCGQRRALARFDPRGQLLHARRARHGNAIVSCCIRPSRRLHIEARVFRSGQILQVRLEYLVVLDRLARVTRDLAHHRNHCGIDHVIAAVDRLVVLDRLDQRRLLGLIRVVARLPSNVQLVSPSMWQRARSHVPLVPMMISPELL